MAYKRKTIDIYNIVTFTDFGKEILCCEYTYKEAMRRIKEYRENQSEYTYIIVKSREKIKNENI